MNMATLSNKSQNTKKKPAFVAKATASSVTGESVDIIDVELKPADSSNKADFSDILNYVQGEDISKENEQDVVKETIQKDDKNKTASQSESQNTEKSNSKMNETNSTKNKTGGAFKSFNIPRPTIRKRSFFRTFAIAITLICLLLLGSGLYAIRQLNTFTGGVFEGSNSGDILQVLTTGFSSTPQPLAGADQGRTNILLIGKDAAAGLTDSIMIASLYHNEKSIATVNIPRDFWVRHPVLGGSKINALYPYAESYFGEGQGPQKLSDFLSGELQIPIHYWAIVNFDGLQDVVNEVGGIDVNVDKAFTDCEYPTDNYSGYMRPCPRFQAGVQRMDGKTALIYSRSRHGAADEGDFSRARRQSIVVEAILKTFSAQMKSGQLALNPNKIAAYLQLFGSNVRTSIKVGEIPSFYETFKNLDLNGNFHRLVWQNGNGFLCAALDTRGSVVTYCDGTEPSGTERAGSSKRAARLSVQNLLTNAIEQEKQNSP